MPIIFVGSAFRKMRIYKQNSIVKKTVWKNCCQMNFWVNLNEVLRKCVKLKKLKKLQAYKADRKNYSTWKNLILNKWHYLSRISEFFEKWLLSDHFKKICSETICEIHNKKPVMEHFLVLRRTSTQEVSFEFCRIFQSSFFAKQIL